MSYSLVMARRRIEALESLPSARKPLLIRGGLPRDFDPRAAHTPAPAKNNSLSQMHTEPEPG
jgi:hypothetical protein